MKEIGEGILIETGFDGVNVGAIRTSEGVVCIDAPSYPRDAREWAFRLEKTFAQPIRLLIVTDFHGDRILNTRWFNAPVMTHSLVAERINSLRRRYPRHMIDSLRKRNSSAGRELMHTPVHRPSISYTSSICLKFHPYTISLSHNPGPTPANTWVAIQEEKVLFVGDSLVSGTMPVLSHFLWRSWISSLSKLSSEFSSYSYIVPGRGELTDPDLIQTMTNNLKEIEEMVLDLGGSDLSSIDLAESVQVLLRKLPNDSLPREWLINELTIGLKRAHEQLNVNLDEEKIGAPYDQYV